MVDKKKKKAKTMAKKTGMSYSESVNILNKNNQKENFEDFLFSQTNLFTTLVTDVVDRCVLNTDVVDCCGLNNARYVGKFVRKTKEPIYERILDFNPEKNRKYIIPITTFEKHAKFNPTYEEIILWYLRSALEDHKNPVSNKYEYDKNNNIFTTMICKNKRLANRYIKKYSEKVDLNINIEKIFECKYLDDYEILLLTDPEYLGILSIKESSKEFGIFIANTENVRRFDPNLSLKDIIEEAKIIEYESNALNFLPSFQLGDDGEVLSDEPIYGIGFEI